MYFSQATVIAFLAATAAAKAGVYERDAAYHDLLARDAMPDAEYNQLYARHAAADAAPNKFTEKLRGYMGGHYAGGKGATPGDEDPSSQEMGSSRADMPALGARDAELSNPLSGLWGRLKGKSPEERERGPSVKARSEAMEAREAEAQPKGLGDCFGLNCGKPKTKGDMESPPEAAADFNPDSLPPLADIPRGRGWRKGKGAELPYSSGSVRGGSPGGVQAARRRDLSGAYGLMERDFDLDERDLGSEELYSRSLEDEELLARREYEDEMLARRDYDELSARDYEPLYRRAPRHGRGKNAMPDLSSGSGSDMNAPPDSGFGGSSGGSFGGSSGGSLGDSPGGSLGGGLGGGFDGSSAGSLGGSSRSAQGLAARDYEPLYRRVAPPTRGKNTLPNSYGAETGGLSDMEGLPDGSFGGSSAGGFGGSSAGGLGGLPRGGKGLAARDYDDLMERDFEDNDLFARDDDDLYARDALDTRSKGSIWARGYDDGSAMGGADTAGGMGGAADGAAEGMGGARGGMAGANGQQYRHNEHRWRHPTRWFGSRKYSNQGMSRRDLLELQRRELGNQRRSFDDFDEGLAARDYEADLEARDYEDLEARDHEDLETRDYEDLEARDYEDLEARDYEDLEARDYEDPEMFY